MSRKSTIDGTCPVCGNDLGLPEPTPRQGIYYSYCTKCDTRIGITSTKVGWYVSKSGWLDFVLDADCRQCYWEYLAKVRLANHPSLSAFISVFILKK